MSTTNSSDDESSGPETFFDVQSHDDVCGNCFRRTHFTFERNYAVDVYKVDDFEWDTWARRVDLPDAKYPVRENRTSVPADPITRGTVNYCKCGYPKGEQHRPLPKKLFFSYAQNLLDRYREFGIMVDETTFMDCLDALKSDPSEQFADDRLYGKATEEAKL